MARQAQVLRVIILLLLVTWLFTVGLLLRPRPELALRRDLDTVPRDAPRVDNHQKQPRPPAEKAVAADPDPITTRRLRSEAQKAETVDDVKPQPKADGVLGQQTLTKAPVAGDVLSSGETAAPATRRSRVRRTKSPALSATPAPAAALPDVPVEFLPAGTAVTDDEELLDEDDDELALPKPEDTADRKKKPQTVSALLRKIFQSDYSYKVAEQELLTALREHIVGFNFTVLDLGSGAGGFATSLAIKYPHATIVSIEGDPALSAQHQASARHAHVPNNLIGQHTINTDLVGSLVNSTDLFQYQVLRAPCTLARALLPAEFEEQLGRLLTLANVTFLEVPTGSALRAAGCPPRYFDYWGSEDEGPLPLVRAAAAAARITLRVEAVPSHPQSLVRVELVAVPWRPLRSHLSGLPYLQAAVEAGSGVGPLSYYPSAVSFDLLFRVNLTTAHRAAVFGRFHGELDLPALEAHTRECLTSIMPQEMYWAADRIFFVNASGPLDPHRQLRHPADHPGHEDGDEQDWGGVIEDEEDDEEEDDEKKEENREQKAGVAETRRKTTAAEDDQLAKAERRDSPSLPGPRKIGSDRRSQQEEKEQKVPGQEADEMKSKREEMQRRIARLTAGAEEPALKENEQAEQKKDAEEAVDAQKKAAEKFLDRHEGQAKEEKNDGPKDLKRDAGAAAPPGEGLHWKDKERDEEDRLRAGQRREEDRVPPAAVKAAEARQDEKGGETGQKRKLLAYTPPRSRTGTGTGPAPAPAPAPGSASRRQGSPRSAPNPPPAPPASAEKYGYGKYAGHVQEEQAELEHSVQLEGLNTANAKPALRLLPPLATQLELAAYGEKAHFGRTWPALRPQLNALGLAPTVLVHDSGVGLLSTKIARHLPQATVVSLAQTLDVADEHLRALWLLELHNNLVCHPNQTGPALYRFLATLPDLFDVQYAPHAFDSLAYSTEAELQSALGSMLSLARASFLTIPNGPKLSLARQMFAASLRDHERFSHADNETEEEPNRNVLDLIQASAAAAGLGPVTVTLLGDSDVVRVDLPAVRRLLPARYLSASSPSSSSSSSTPRPVGGRRGVSLHTLTQLDVAGDQRRPLFDALLTLDSVPADLSPWHFVLHEGLVWYHPLGAARPLASTSPRGTWSLSSREMSSSLASEIIAQLQKPDLSFIELDSGNGAVSTALAAKFPAATLVSVEENATRTAQHALRLNRTGVANNVVCRQEVAPALLFKLFESPEFFQVCIVHSLFGRFRTWREEEFGKFLNYLLPIAQTHFLPFPSPRLLSAATALLFPDLLEAPLPPWPAAYAASSHPLPVFIDYPAKLVQENLNAPGLTSVAVRVLQPAGAPPYVLLRLDLLNLTRTVHHHFDYRVDGHQRAYLLRYENGSTTLVRSTDKKTIVYDRFGVSLITLLRMGLLEERREAFYSEFLRLPVYEDMATWNIQFKAGALRYTDRDTEDAHFERVVPYAYQVLLSLMNYKRTVQDFGKCGANNKVEFNMPWIGDCTKNRRFDGPCKDPAAPVPCADGKCKSTFVECMRDLQSLGADAQARFASPDDSFDDNWGGGLYGPGAGGSEQSDAGKPSTAFIFQSSDGTKKG